MLKLEKYRDDWINLQWDEKLFQSNCHPTQEQLSETLNKSGRTGENQF